VKLIDPKRLYARRLGAPCANSKNNAEQPFATARFCSIRVKRFGVLGAARSGGSSGHISSVF